MSMVVFAFTKQAERCFLKLPKAIQERIKKKLQELKRHDDILSAVRRLTDFESATHRLRIGPYRLILFLEMHTEEKIKFLVVDVGHRKDIYR